MRPHEIDRFFTLLSRRTDFAVEIILTGGAVSVLEGGLRVTRDLDFQIRIRPKINKQRERLASALVEVSRMTGIAVQYDESIEGWDVISWPRRHFTSRLYKRFGSVSVYLLNPLLWSIGKISRYLSSDVEDVATLFKKLKLPPREVVRAWGEALGQSPMSSGQPLFKQHVLHFLKTHGPSIWGPSLKVEQCEALFLESARQSSQQKRRSREYPP